MKTLEYVMYMYVALNFYRQIICFIIEALLHALVLYTHSYMYNYIHHQYLSCSIILCLYCFQQSEIDTTDTTALIHTCSTKEAKYILENMVTLTIESVSGLDKHVENINHQNKITICM